MKRIILCGYNGKMGKAITRYLMDKVEYKIVCGVSSINTVINKTVIFNNLQSAIDSYDADLIIDFTIASIAYEHAKVAIENKKPIIIGTTGITTEMLEDLSHLNQNQTPVLIVPNFSIGAVLLSNFASIVAKYFNECDITEKHNIKKKDAPSGTANYLKNVIDTRNCLCNTNITSYRIGDVVAEHQVTFLNDSEQISISHASYDRSSFMFGIKYCIDHVEQFEGIHYGIENIIKL